MLQGYVGVLLELLVFSFNVILFKFFGMRSCFTLGHFSRLQLRYSNLPGNE